MVIPGDTLTAPTLPRRERPTLELVMAEERDDLVRTLVRDLMSRPVHTLAPVQSLELAEALMARHHVRHLPVVDEENRVLGLVTQRDVLTARSTGLVVPVSRIMREDVWTIRPDVSAGAAARHLRAHHFGCLPVTDHGRLVGILTTSDLLRLVAEPQPLPPVATWPIARVMTSTPVTITPDTTLAGARIAFERYGIHHLPVIEDGVPLGLVSERDIGVAEAVFGSNTDARALHVAHLLGNTRFHGVVPTAPLAEVVGTMVRDRLDAVLVVDEGVLAGIFTLADGYRIFAELLGRGGQGASARANDASWSIPSQ